MRLIVYLSTHPYAAIGVVTVLYLIILAATILSAFKPSREKGKSFDFTLFKGQSAQLNLGGNHLASVKASSDEKFILKVANIQIESQPFSDYVNIGQGQITCSGDCQLIKGDDVDIQINPENDAELIKFDSKGQKITAIGIAIFFTILLGFFVWIALATATTFP